MAVAADRNPWMTKPDERGGTEMGWMNFTPDEDSLGGTADQARVGNTDAHQLEGQNVLFMDSHVALEKRAYSGTEQDNIYTKAVLNAVMKTVDYYKGTPFQMGQNPTNRKDSFLINEGTATSGSSTGGGAGGGGR